MSTRLKRTLKSLVEHLFLLRLTNKIPNTNSVVSTNVALSGFPQCYLEEQWMQPVDMLICDPCVVGQI